jgi:guanylate kinase
MRGTLYIFLGPSGVGKGTILKEALARLTNIKYSVSCTTRSPRPGLDEEGKTYYFISEQEFKERAAAGEFLEYANVHGHYYGTRRDIVEEALSSGTDIILEIDVQGAFIVKEKMPDAVMVFIKPPSIGELVSRLAGRCSDAAADCQLRIKNAEKELACADKYDYIIVNDIVENAVRQFVQIVLNNRKKTPRP